MSRGYLQGAMSMVQASQQRRAARKQDVLTLADQRRKDELLRMQKQQFADKQQIALNKQIVSQGLAEAVKAGGYEMGIDYLKQADPDRAMRFESNKLDLDKKIMRNDVLKTTSELKKDQARFETYELGGKYANAILRLPLNQQEQAYKTLYPILNKLTPGISPELDAQSRNTLQLFQTQGMPGSIIQGKAKLIGKSQTKLGKLFDDLNRATQAGDRRQMQALNEQIEAVNTKAKADQMDLAATRLRMTKDKLQATRGYQKDIDNASKDFIGKSQTFATVLSLFETLQQNPTNGMAQTNLQTQLARLGGEKGPMSDADIKRWSSAAGIATVSKQVESVLKGNNVALNAQELADARAIVDGFIKHQVSLQNATEQEYVQMLENNPQFKSLVRPKDLILPTKRFQELLNTGSPEQQLLQRLPEEHQKQAKEALDQVRGNPEQLQKVLQNIQNMVGQ